MDRIEFNMDRFRRGSLGGSGTGLGMILNLIMEIEE